MKYKFINQIFIINIKSYCYEIPIFTQTLLLKYFIEIYLNLALTLTVNQKLLCFQTLFSIIKGFIEKNKNFLQF